MMGFSRQRSTLLRKGRIGSLVLSHKFPILPFQTVNTECPSDTQISQFLGVDFNGGISPRTVRIAISIENSTSFLFSTKPSFSSPPSFEKVSYSMPMAAAPLCFASKALRCAEDERTEGSFCVIIENISFFNSQLATGHGLIRLSIAV